MNFVFLLFLAISIQWSQLSAAASPLDNLGHETAETICSFLTENSDFDVTSQNESGLTFLHKAAEWGNIDLFQMLIKKGASIYTKDNYQRTPFHYAVFNGQIDIVEKIITIIKSEKKSVQDYINAQNGQGETALLLALSICPGHDNKQNENKEEIVKILIDEKASFIADNDNQTPLHIAAAYNQTDIAKIFIAQGLFVNSQDKGGNTPLHWAVWKNNKVLAILLIRAGAQIETKNQRGKSPLDSANEGMKRTLFIKN